MNANRNGGNPFWGVVVAVAAMFCVTILAYLVSGLGRPSSPLNRFFVQYGFVLVCVEAAAIVVAGVLALAVDRRQTVRRLRDSAAQRHAAERLHR
jgi:uncharacterized membrane protein YhaH (DUF805 family)